MLNARRCRSAVHSEEATKVLQESPISPQSNDVRKGDSRGQACVASALAPGTVTLGEEEEPGAMAVDEAEEEVEVEDEARVPKTKKGASGNDTSRVASASPHASPV